MVVHADSNSKQRRLTSVLPDDVIVFSFMACRSLDKDRLMFIFKDGSTSFFGQTEEQRR